MNMIDTPRPNGPSGDQVVPPSLRKVLDHQSGTAAHQSAPPEFPLVFPWVGYLETQTVNVEPERILHVRHGEERHGLLQVRFC